MKKPISNFYTVIWVDAPDAPAQPGTLAPGDAAMAVFRDVISHASCSWQIPRSWQIQKLAGALTSVMAAFALVFTKG